jgi:hypothetical protein
MASRSCREVGNTNVVAEMLQLLAGAWISRAIHAAVELRLADLLNDGPQSSADLALATETHAPALHRLLRTLAAIGIVDENDDGQFALSPLGATLCTDEPGTLRSWAEFVLGETASRSWDALSHSIRTGETAFDHVHGMDVWEHRARNPEHARLFDAAMASSGAASIRAILSRCSFPDAGTVVDVGGGDGSLLAVLLGEHPNMRGVLVDVPHVAEKARARLAQAGLSSRCEVVVGDAFACVPHAADVYVLCRVIHDWSDESAVRMLAACRAAMADRSRLLLIERVLPARVTASTSTAMLFLSDLNMMVMNGGRERTEADFCSLLNAARLQLNRVIPTDSPVSVLECARP